MRYYHKKDSAEMDYVPGNVNYYKENDTSYDDIILSQETPNASDPDNNLTETEIEPKHKFNTKPLLVFFALLLLFLLSCCGIVLLYATNMLRSQTETNSTISRNLLLDQEQWEGPDVRTFLKIYIFNYTNVNAYSAGQVPKLHVEEIGPFVYEEFSKKINIEFHPDDTVSYQNQRTHQYRFDLSNGRSPYEHVIVPNVPLMELATARENMNFSAKLAMTTVLTTMDPTPFLNLRVEQFIWGYDDNICDILENSKVILRQKKKLKCEKFGVLTSRKETSKDVITVNTGKNGVNKLGQIENLNGKNELEFWATKECNKIQGSDGTIFPPDTITQKEPVQLYYKYLCRRLPMIYEKEVEFLNGTVSAYKYVLLENVFDLPESNAENQCFCNVKTGSCAPQGFFNATLCTDEVPLFASFAHLYKADAVIANAITGLNANLDNHESYWNIHPSSGFVISGASRLQMNVDVRKSSGVNQLDMFRSNMILPMWWMEAEIETEDLSRYIEEENEEVNNEKDKEEAEETNIVTTTIPPIVTYLKIVFFTIAIIALIAMVILIYLRQTGKIKILSD